ncbi:bifunctional heptose 7-phosphate kinase/heptose 1-phosphate adenyltransferase [Phormidesmis priestleyi]
MKELAHFLDRLPHLQILVIGEAMLDRYLEGAATRLCQEAPVPVVTLSQTQNLPGAAANTAVNLRSWGCQVRLFSVIGDDWEGALLRQALLKQDVNTDQILVDVSRSTLTKQRILDGAKLLLRLDQGTTEAISPDLEQQLIDHLSDRFSDCDAMIISDYGYGILTPRIIHTIAQLQLQNSKPIVVDAKQLSAYRNVGVTAVKPNYHQVLQLLGETDISQQSRADWVATQANWILNLTGSQLAAVTLDRDGAVILQRDRPPYRIYAKPSPQRRTIGAGDTFAAMLTAALATKIPPLIAADFAAAAAAIVVLKEATSTCTIDEFTAYFLGMQNDQCKITN